MNDYDFSLRHASVRSGAWVGFALAWKGLAGVAGLSARPHLHWRPWLLDAAAPNDPTAGSWGVWQWRLDVAMLDGATGLAGRPPTDGRGSADMRADLLAYMSLPALELRDMDGAVYTVKMTAYSEQTIEPYDAGHTGGGWVATVQFAVTTAP